MIALAMRVAAPSRHVSLAIRAATERWLKHVHHATLWRDRDSYDPSYSLGRGDYDLARIWVNCLIRRHSRIIGFAVILIIGWIIASALATAVAAILRTVKFNDLAQRAGISGFVQKMGVHTDAAGFLATLVKWFVRLIVLVTAFDALGLPAVSQVLQQILLWLPNLVVALSCWSSLAWPPTHWPAWCAAPRPSPAWATRTCWRLSPGWRSGRSRS